MAHSDKNILITPNISSTTNDPVIRFSGADASTTAQNIDIKVYPTNNGTLSFEGSVGQLFSITNSMSGTIYSVNDISGIPSIEVLDTGLIKLAQYSGNVLVGTGTDSGEKVQINGTVKATSFNSITGLSSTNPLMNGTVAIGTGTTAARSDHIHPTDTSRAASSHTQAESTITFTDITTGNATASVHGYLPKLSGNTTTYLRGDGSWQIVAGGISSETKTTAFTAVKDKRYICDSSASAFTVTLPSTPTVGDTIEFIDSKSSWYTYNVTLNRNGKKINGLVEDFILDVDDIACAITFVSEETGWLVQVMGGGGGSSSGATITNEASASATYYPTFTSVTSGAMTTASVSTSKLTFQPSTGTLYSTIFNSSSDKNLKYNIETITNSLDIINNLRGVTFNWKENDNKSSGLIAQELETILPELVSTDINNIKSINYDAIIGYLVESIKELKHKIDILEGNNG